MFDFPTSPTIGQTYQVAGITYVWDGQKWLIQGTPIPPVKTAQARNRAVNGAGQISQENGNTGAASAAANGGYYPADQFLTAWSVATGTATAIRNADNSIALWTTVGATFTANSYASINQRIEGNMVADFGWGAAGAKQAVVTFKAYHLTGGTFTFSVQNAASDRCFLAPYTLPANQLTAVSIVVPGDTTGTWAKDNTIGLTLQWQLGTGSTYTGVAGWQAGNKNNLPGSTNALAAASTGLNITNVGLYLDPDSTGIAPPFEVPNYASELIACKRYWQRYTIVVETSTVAVSTVYPVSLRAAPTISGGGAGFTSAQASGEASQFYQTTRGYQTLTFNARM